MSERFPQLFWGMVALALGLVLSALLAAGAIRNIKRANDEIAVTGSAKRPIRADFIVWKLSVTAQAPVVQDAYRELSGSSQQIRAFLKASGMADSLVTIDPVETLRQNRMLVNGTETGDLAGYKLTQRFTVRSADVRGVTALSQRANELINAGVPLVSPAPEYLYTHLDQVRTQMLAEATRDAKLRAEAIAKSVGSEIGAVRSAKMGVFQITPRNSTEVSDYGINDTSSLEKDITAVVRVSFAVK
ncbi:MAG TPA: SIMPL domain-containing protein [Longimicrobiaceae bacterium]|jgi:hypothetical protein|nr:SIMPL domain-containing protein [Longimicrobiaceae bacterium]